MMSLIPKKYYLDDIFNNFLSDPEESNMKCDIFEKDGIYHIEMDVPGYKKEDIIIECDKGYLSIIAEKKIENNDEDKEKKYIRRERVYGKYQREFYLGDVDAEKINAEFIDGELKITVPKKIELPTKKTIEIK